MKVQLSGENRVVWPHKQMLQQNLFYLYNETMNKSFRMTSILNDFCENGNLSFTSLVG
jgi:hypothetical protein